MTLNNPIFNSESKDFDASIFIGDKTHNLTLSDFSVDEEIKAANLADKIYKWLKVNLDTTKIYAASLLTELKNDSWLEENEIPLTQTKFAETIIFDGIIAFSEGSFQIFFYDNDIFWGHSIVVDIDKDFKFDGANISG